MHLDFTNADGTPVYLHCPGVRPAPRLGDRLQAVLLMALIGAVCAVPIVTTLFAGAAR